MTDQEVFEIYCFSGQPIGKLRELTDSRLCNMSQYDAKLTFKRMVLYENRVLKSHLYSQFGTKEYRREVFSKFKHWFEARKVIRSIAAGESVDAYN